MAAVASSALLVAVTPRHSPVAIVLVGTSTAACGAIAVLERQRPRLGVRPIVAAIAIVFAVAVITPPRTSNDLWSYVMYGRTVSVHSASPYDHVPADFPSDPFTERVSRIWRASRLRVRTSIRWLRCDRDKPRGRLRTREPLVLSDHGNGGRGGRTCDCVATHAEPGRAGMARAAPGVWGDRRQRRAHRRAHRSRNPRHRALRVTRAGGDGRCRHRCRGTDEVDLTPRIGWDRPVGLAAAQRTSRRPRRDRRRSDARARVRAGTDFGVSRARYRRPYGDARLGLERSRRGIRRTRCRAAACASARAEFDPHRSVLRVARSRGSHRLGSRVARPRARVARSPRLVRRPLRTRWRRRTRIPGTRRGRFPR